MTIYSSVGNAAYIIFYVSYKVANLRVRWRLLFCALILLSAVLSAGTQAQTFNAPTQGVAGVPFTLEWSGIRTYAQLQERSSSGAWNNIGDYYRSSNSITLEKPAGTYTYRLRDCLISGNHAGVRHFCDILPEVKTVVVGPAPSSPSSLSGVINDVTGVVTTTWAVAGGTFNRYEIQQQFGSGAWVSRWSGTGNGSGAQRSITLPTPHLSQAGSYRWRIRACFNSETCSAWRLSPIVSFSVPTVPSFSNSIPESSLTGNYTISWSSVPRALHYTLRENEASHPNTTTTSRSYSGKTSGSYRYQVRACNMAGCSDYSAIKVVEVIIPQSSSSSSSGQITGQHVVSTPPSGTGSGTPVGAVAGDFQVDESGAATYSIPIAVPAGTANIVPHLSLNYSSYGGNGLLGKGWSLGGLSAVSRCRQTLFQDGQAKAISWSQDDRYCLNGQRLVVVSGVYGAPGSVYKTETDSFVEVTAVGGTLGHPDYFTAEGKDGSITRYGGVGVDHSEKAAYVNGVKQGNRVISWNIKRFEDSVGNQIVYIYSEDPDYHRLSEIRYAFGALNGEQGHQARVALTYQNRDDYSHAFIAGYAFKNNSLLTEIASFNGSSLYRKYLFDYHLSMPSAVNSLARLKSVEECSTSSQCFPKKTFDWNQRNMAISQSVTSGIAVNGYDSRIVDYRPIDIDGDGRQDVVWLQAVTSGNQYRYELMYAMTNESGEFFGRKSLDSYFSSVGSESNHRLHVIDYNADGRSDLLYYRNGQWTLFLSTPNNDGTWELKRSSAQLPFSNKNMKFGDLNSNGLMDAFYFDSTSKSIKLYELERNSSVSSNSSEYYKFSSVKIIGIDGVDDHDWTYVSGSITIGDYNGDGRMDFAIQAYYSVQVGSCPPTSAYGCTPTFTDNDLIAVFSRTNSGFSYYNRINFGTSPTKPLAIQSPDINGDGLSDIAFLVGQIGNNNGGIWKYALNNGKGFEASRTIFSADSDNADRQPLFIDYNMDGFPDFVWHDKSSGYLKYKIWVSVTQGFSSNSHTIREARKSNTDAYTLLDLKGSGAFDFVHFNMETGNIRVFHSLSGYENRLWLMSRINNGVGFVTNVNYRPLTYSGSYVSIRGSFASSNGEQEICYETHAWIAPGGIKQGIKEVCSMEQLYVYDNETFYRKINEPFGSVGADGGHLSAPVLEISGPMYVVSSVATNTLVANNSEHFDQTAYIYHLGRVQAGGRGFLGFKKITKVDLNTGINIQTEYHQNWPYTFRPYKTITRTSEGVLLNESINTWQVETFGSSINGSLRYQIYVKETEEKSYDLVEGGVVQGQLLNSVKKSSVYDEYGNPISIRVVTQGDDLQETQVSTNHYGSTVWELRMGRLSRAESKIDQGGDSITRVSSFEYYSDGPLRGILKSETVEPDLEAYRVTTSYEHDAYGNVIKKTLSGTGVEARASKTIYDEGRYVRAIINELGHMVSEVTQRDGLGRPTQVVSANGVVAHITYDAMGREVLRGDNTGSWLWVGRAFCGGSVVCPAGAQVRVESRVAGGSREFEYQDLRGRVIRSTNIDFKGRSVHTDFEYGVNGMVSRQSTPYFSSQSPDGWIENRYDLLNRLERVEKPDGSHESVHYNGRETISINSLGQIRKEIYDGLGRLFRVEDNLGGSVSYQYDIIGNLLSARTEAPDSNPVTIKMCYDILGRKVAMHDPGKGGFRGNGTLECPAVLAGDKENGWWYYNYNVFGELTSQTDAKKQRQTQAYDQLGRMIKRTDWRADDSVESHSSWFYDTSPGGQPQVGALGNLTAVVVSSNGISESCNGNNLCTTYTYDQYGRLVNTLRLFPGDSNGYVSGIVYDSIGRPFAQTDALSGMVTNGTSGTMTRYNSYGYEYLVVDIETGDKVHEIIDVNARGQITRERRLGGAETTYGYNEKNGLKLEQRAYAAGATFLPIQDIKYTWDSLGNLKSRLNQSLSENGSERNNLRESFCYDSLNRLIKTYTNSLTGSCNISIALQDIRYDGLGNITYKHDVGLYIYANNITAGPQAVTRAGTTDYQYDHNGNLVNGGGRSIKYTVHDKPYEISNSNHKTVFHYGADRQRYRRIDTGVGNTTTLYLGNVERITKPNGMVEWKRYVAGVIYTTTTNAQHVRQGATQRFVIYNDHLGSTDVITTADGIVRQSLAFDPWGQRRHPDTAIAFSVTQLINFNSDLSRKGFTGHEHMDELGLIHMNGRIYDPRLGRFLQADPFVQSPENTQSYNRYSYVWNNPLNATDPSGYFLKKIWREIKPLVGAFVTWAIATVCVPCHIAVAGMMGGFAGAMANGGDTLLSAFSGAAGGVHWFAGMVASGMASAGSGGRFKHGFLAAGIGALGGHMGQGGGAVRSFVATAVAGGVATEVTGGKFRNGASTAAFTWALAQGAEAIKTNSSGSNASGIEILENLPDNPEAVYQEGRELAAAQKELNVDESVQFDNRHAFCPETCNTDTIRYRSSAAEGIEFLKNNSDYRLLLGAHWNGQSYIFPGATVSMTITYPVGTAGYRNYFLGSGPSGFVVTGAESVLGVIAHETGHGVGIGHGARMDRREYDAIMRSRQ